MIGIYKITNPNNKIYIGQSINIEKRFKNYLNQNCKYQRKLYNSLNKYGVENHVFEIIEECVVENLNERERYYQDLHNVVENGLNSKYVKSNDKSGYVSEDTKKRLSVSRTGKCCGSENHMYGKYGKDHPVYGRKHTNTAKENISNKQLGNLNHMFGKNYDLNPNSKKVIDTNTNIIYNSIKEAAEILNIKYSYLRSMITNNCKNKTNLIYFTNT